MSQYALAQVTLLVERGASAYQQAVEGFRDEIGAAVAVTEIQIDLSGRLPQKALNQISMHPPRLIVAVGTRAARESFLYLPQIPALHCLALRPLPGASSEPQFGGVFLNLDIPRQIESARKLLPNLKNIGIVYDETTSAPLIRDLQKRLPPGERIIPRVASTPQIAAREMESLFNSVLGPGDAFLLLWDSVVANPANFKLLVELSIKNKIPLIAPARAFVEAGALISTGVNYEQAGRQVAIMARQVLSGAARPADFSSFSPASVVITINAAVAAQLGIRVPPDVQADILGAPQLRIAP